MIIQNVAIGALVDPEGRVLLTRRSERNSVMPNFWEFPGGKILSKELPEEALVRELREELSIETWDSCLAPVTFVSHSYTDFHVILFLFICRRWDGVIFPKEGQKFSWVKKNELRDYKMPEANSYLVAILRDWI